MTVDLVIAGRGPVTVLLHGCPTTPDVLAPIAERVSSFGTAVQVSLPGYGRSPALAPGWTIAQLHEVLERALLSRGLREVALVGFSGGAYHALAIACRGLLSVTRVVALAGVSELTPDERTAFQQTADALRVGTDLRSIAGARFLSAAFRDAHPERIVEVERWLDATTPANLAGELSVFADAESLTDKLASLAAPVLARVGSEDVATPPAKSRAIVEAARRGRLEVVPGAGHALMIEDREGTIDSVIAALRV